jgi:hypothetical protein
MAGIKAIDVSWETGDKEIKRSGVFRFSKPSPELLIS